MTQMTLLRQSATIVIAAQQLPERFARVHPISSSRRLATYKGISGALALRGDLVVKVEGDFST
jgi:hypothetical protein